jgi:hypothetical protein
MRKVSVFAVVAILVVTLNLWAQSDRGTVTGVVTDSSGAVLVGASVKALNTATGGGYEVRTVETGNYVIPVLPAGTYQLIVEQKGFKRQVRDAVIVEVNETLRQDIILELGELTQTVNVSAESPLIRPSTSDLGTVVSNQQILDLPLAMQGEQRSPLSFMQLIPGVTGRGNSTERNFSTSVNGGQSITNEIQLDGASIMNSNLPGDARILGFPQDAVQEFKLTTNSFSAEFGRTGGGVTSFTIRSGTNQIHGSLFEFLRNDKLDARGFFNQTRAVNRQNEFGANVGAPIIRNKTFVFAYYNGFRVRRGAQNALATVPTPAFRRGDFSNLRDATGTVIPIYDPRSTQPDGRGGFTRTQFPNNVIPSSQLSVVAQNVVAFYPDPTYPDRTQLNYLSSVGSGSETNQWGLKIDHNLATDHKLSGFLTRSKMFDAGSAVFPAPIGPVTPSEQPIWLARLNYDWIIRPNLINHAVLGFNRNVFGSGLTNPRPGWPAKLGLKGVEQAGQFPQFNFTNGYTNIGGGGEQVLAEDGYNLVDNITWITGRHTLKFGIDFRRNGHNLRSTGRDSGFFNFSFLETSLPNSPERSLTGDGFASFILGAMDSGERYVYTTTIGDRFRYYSGFIQDDFRVTSRLTLNMGLRYDVPQARVEVADRMSSFDPSVPNPGAAGRLGAIVFAGDGPGRIGQRTFADTDFKQFGPRAGFAFSLNPKTVIRSGYGIYYATGGASQGNGHLVGFNMGYTAVNSVASTDTGVTPAVYLDNGFPENFPLPPFINPAYGVGTTVYYMAKEDAHSPYLQNWNFNIQRELPANILLDAAYAGSKGTRLITNLYNHNQVDPRHLSLGSLLTADINSSAARAANIPYPYSGFTGSVAQALRPYPQYTGITRPYQNAGSSTYHALQMKVQKRFSHGLNFLVAYTMSKSITNSEAQFAVPFSSGAQDSFNHKPEKSISQNDYPHNLVMSYSYELPLGTGKPFLNGNRVVAKLAGGWRVSGIQQYQSGSPMNVIVSNTLPIFNSVLRPNVVAGVPVRAPVGEGGFDPARDRWINPNAFTLPAPYTFGNAGRWLSDLRRPAFINEDFSIMKRTVVHERVTVDFRTDFFNAFNRVIFGGLAGSPFSSGFNNNLSNPATFGLTGSQANLPRQIQFGLKVNF